MIVACLSHEVRTALGVILLGSGVGLVTFGVLTWLFTR
jgi:hypothetical protein